MNTTLPISWYLNNDIFALEQKQIFEKEWLFACSSSQVQDAGNYITLDIMKRSIIIIRQPDKKVKAFYNVCRHRNSQLLTGSGTCKGDCITCPYHSWTFELSGELRKAPYCQDIEDFHRDDYSLIEVAIEEMFGLIFVNLGKNLPPQRYELLKLLESYNFNNFIYHSSKTFNIKCNWKTFLENYQECYHCRTLHPLFNKNYDLDKYMVYNGDHFSHHTCPRKQVSDELGSKAGEWLYIWPSLALALYESYYDTLEVIPITPTETELRVTFYGRRDLPKEILDHNINDVSFQTFEEDIAASEKVQCGLLTAIHVKDWKSGPLNPKKETGVIYFDSLVRKALENQ